jgi:hypothetical protein
LSDSRKQCEITIEKLLIKLDSFKDELEKAYKYIDKLEKEKSLRC